jgi:lipid-A-disaccharide synthase
MKYFLIAGEASGDLHAAHLIASLKQQDERAEFRFLGGDLMAAQAAVEPIIHYRDMAYMGFMDVVKHLGKILGFLGTARRHIE